MVTLIFCGGKHLFWVFEVKKVCGYCLFLCFWWEWHQTALSNAHRQWSRVQMGFFRVIILWILHFLWLFFRYALWLCSPEVLLFFSDHFDSHASLPRLLWVHSVLFGLLFVLVHYSFCLCVFLFSGSQWGSGGVAIHLSFTFLISLIFAVDLHFIPLMFPVIVLFPIGLEIVWFSCSNLCD